MRRLLLLIILLASNIFAGAAPPTVLDIAALKALAPGAYPTVQVLRYSTDTSFGYAGGGVVNWVAGSTKAAAACSVYVPNSNPAVGRWERPRSPFRLASQCGIMTLDDTISGNVRFAALAGSGTRMMVVDPFGQMSTQSIPSGGSLANPTGTIGLTAVNGSLTSGMRSDGAPALSQAITPVWTGVHQFSAQAAFGAGLTFSGNGTSGAATVTRIAGDGLQIRGIAGSSYDLALMESGGSYLLRNPIGGTAVEFPGSGVSVEALTVGSTQTNSEALIFGGNGTAGTYRLFRSAAGGLNIRGGAGSTDDLRLSSASGGSLLQNPTGTNDVVVAGSGGSITLTPLAGSGTRMVVADATGVISTQSIPSGSTLANPTGTIGLTAVNGSATSGMRSDGAPALSQAIAPTWTGQHTFNTAPIAAGIRSSVTNALVRTVSTDSLLISGSNSADSGMNIILTGDDPANYNSFSLRSDTSRIMYYDPNSGMRTYAGWTFTNNVTLVPNATLEVQYHLTTTGTALFTHGRTAATLYGVTETAGNIAIDINQSDFYSITLDDNSTLSNPTNSSSGRHFTIRVRQDGTGGNTLNFGSNYRFPGGVAPTITTAADAIDYLSFIYDEVAGKWDFVGNAFNLLPAGS